MYSWFFCSPCYEGRLYLLWSKVVFAGNFQVKPNRPILHLHLNPSYLPQNKHCVCRCLYSYILVTTKLRRAKENLSVAFVSNKFRLLLHLWNYWIAFGFADRVRSVQRLERWPWQITVTTSSDPRGSLAGALWPREPNPPHKLNVFIVTAKLHVTLYFK